MLLSFALLAAVLGAGGTTPQDPVPIEKDPTHQIVWEIPQYRIFDIVIPPHSESLYHTHSHDMVVARIPFTPPEASNRPDKVPALSLEKREFEISFEAYDTPTTHRLTNPGEKPLHLVALEFMRPYSEV